MPVLDLPDLALNYQVVGPAPGLGPGAAAPVALIHGLGANLAFWYLGALRHLARSRTYLLHDLRGHGASSMPDHGYDLAQMADDFRALLDRLGVERAHVVGHSHGARVALAFALAHPERVASLTVADTQVRALQPPMRLADWPHWAEWRADLAARGVTTFPPEDALIDFRLLAELGPRAAGGRGGRAQAEGEAEAEGAEVPAPRLRARRGALAAAPGRRIDLRSRQMGARGADRWRALMETTQAAEEMHDESALVPEGLAGLSVPTLLLYGRLSHCVPTSDRLLSLMGDARRILIPGAGHFFPIVKPQLTARALDAFLARVDGAAPAAGAPRRPLVRRGAPGLSARFAARREGLR